MNERNAFFIALVITSIITLVMAYTVWRKRSTGKAGLFLALCLISVSIYSLGYGMELMSDTLERAMFWVRFQHLGIELIAPTWLLFAVSVSGYEKQITPRFLILLSIVPLYLFVTAETLGWLNLAHHNPRMDFSGAFPIFAYDRNLFNYISVAYFSFCILFSTVLFVLLLFRSAPSFRKHAMIYLIGSMPPWAGLLVYNLGLFNTRIDYTPLLLGVGGLFFVFGFVRLRMLDLIPLARNAVFENMCSGVLILDDNRRVVDFNPALQEIFPQLSQKAVNRPVSAVLYEYSELVAFVHDETSEKVELMVGAGPWANFYQVSKTLMRDKAGKLIGCIVSFYEVTKEKNLMDQLEKLAIQDGLTGIFNRQHFDHLASLEVDRLERYGGVLSMIMLDLDGFKKINDTYGHGAGDLALVTLAQTFSKMIRRSDIFARFGGEEFVLLLPQTDVLAAKTLAERLCEALDQIELSFAGQTFKVHASFGITGFTSTRMMTLETVYRLADQAMYRAKSLGGNRVSICLANEASQPVYVE